MGVCYNDKEIKAKKSENKTKINKEKLNEIREVTEENGPKDETNESKIDSEKNKKENFDGENINVEITEQNQNIEKPLPLLSGNNNEENKDKDKNKNNYTEQETKEIEEKNYTNGKDEYEIFDINKNYYLICPLCNKNIISIELIEYDNDKKDFKVFYKCFCTNKNEKYIYEIIKENIPLCEEHQKELNLICEDCNIIMCKECKIKHENHKIKNIINGDIISEENLNKLEEKKEEFKGINIINKIFNYYKSNKENEKNNDNINISQKI